MRHLVYSVGKECLVGMLRLSGVFRVFRRLNRNRLIILTYHSVLPSASGIDGGESRNVVDEDMFAWQMRYLAKHYRCVALEEAVSLLGSDRCLPPYSVVVTFDDGFRNNLRYAVPILRQCGIPATIFVTTGHVENGTRLLWTERVGRLLGRAAVPQTVTLAGDRKPLTLSFRTAAEREQARRLALTWLKGLPSGQRDEAIRALEHQVRPDDSNPDGAAAPDVDRYTFLNWTDTRELARGDVTIGSHTVEHPILSSLDDESRKREVVESKRQIEQQLGRPCTLFSYPNGTADDFDDRDKANLRKAGYVAALTQIGGLNDKRTDPFALRRLNIGRGHGRAVFIAQVSGFLPWLRSMTTGWSMPLPVPDRALAEASRKKDALGRAA